MLSSAMREAVINIYWKIRRLYWKNKTRILKLYFLVKDRPSTFKNILQEQSNRVYGNFLRHFNRAMNSPNRIVGFLVQIYGEGSDKVGDIYGFFVKFYWSCRRKIGIISGFFVQLYWKWSGKIRFIWGFLVGKTLGYVRQISVDSYWSLKRGYDKLLARYTEGYWQIKKSKFIYPISKSYWFLKYQAQSKILPFFKKRNN